jgi:lauroyl/myristoyl acyltransferase
VGGIVFALLRDNRRSTIANLRRMRGAEGLGGDAMSDRLEALRTFVEFAYCVSETFEFASDDGRSIEVESPPGFDPAEQLPRDQGLIVLTSHFGSWEIGARMLSRFSRPVNLVMAREPNPTVEKFQRGVRESNGLRVIHSDTSVFSSFNMIHALRRGEVVAIQLDRAAPGQVTRDVPFFGTPAPFQVGPFMLARMAEVPLWPVFVARVGPRRYRILPEPMRRIARHAGEDELFEVMADVVGSFERRVREHPRQWFQFRPFWQDGE